MGRFAELKPNKATISGPLVFGLQLNSVQKAREARRRGHLIKPANNCVQSTLEKRAKKIAERTQ
ncbi:15336_t:CDS:2, partial [Entrophospora sp. SA101]